MDIGKELLIKMLNNSTNSCADLDKTLFEDPINLYSIIHFIEYGILAFFPSSI